MGLSPSHLAALTGDRDACAALSVADIDDADDRGLTAMHLAALGGHADCVSALVERGAKIGGVTTIGLAEKNSYSFRTGMRERACTEDLAATLVMDRKATPLHLASARGHGEVVEVLVAARAKIAPKTASGVTPLHCAAQAGSILAVRGLLRHRHPVDPPIRSRSVDGWLDAGMTPLHAAADRGALEIVQALLDAGADPNRHTKLGYSALFFGARSSNPAVLGSLVAHGAGAGILTWRNDPLVETIVRGADECLAVLLAAGVDATAVDAEETAKRGCAVYARPRPLQLAIRFRRMGMIDALCAAGAKWPEYADLREAICYGDVEDVQRRLAEGERFAATRYDDRTSVDLAVGAGSPEIVQTLLAAGEEPNPSRRRGIRALHLAALAIAHVSPVEQAIHRAACLHIARMLLEAGADPNAPDRDGNPALHYARDFPEMFRLLLEFGADPEQRNNFGNISWEK